MVINLPSEYSPLSAQEQQPVWNGNTTIMFGIHDKGVEYYWQGAMPLSIKCFFHGTGYYNVGAGHYATNERSYLILNHAQPYSITIDSLNHVGSFIIFFAAGFAEEVYRSLTTPATGLLDEPKVFTPQSVNFFQKLYAHDDLLSPALFHLRTSLVEKQNDSAWLTERLHEILQRLLQVHKNVYKDLEALPAARAATREELYRRLYRARDFLAASLAHNVTLNDMARVACLSPNHFLRTFRQVFHRSPHQYLTDLRLEEAQRLLAGTNRPVTEICITVGFESLGSFSSLFRRRTGFSPDAYRKQKR